MQLIFLFDFSLVTLEEDDSIAVKVRGPANNEKECFFFLEEILGCVDQVSGKILQSSTPVSRAPTYFRPLLGLSHGLRVDK